jgi:serpin B
MIQYMKITIHFTGISSDEKLYVSSILQKAEIKVNEKGTEASAATVTTLSMKSAVPTFRCDRPFFFLIRDNLSGLVIFAGRVLDPTKN